MDSSLNHDLGDAAAAPGGVVGAARVLGRLSGAGLGLGELGDVLQVVGVVAHGDVGGLAHGGGGVGDDVAHHQPAVEREPPELPRDGVRELLVGHPAQVLDVGPERVHLRVTKHLV